MTFSSCLIPINSDDLHMGHKVQMLSWRRYKSNMLLNIYAYRFCSPSSFECSFMKFSINNGMHEIKIISKRTNALSQQDSLWDCSWVFLAFRHYLNQESGSTSWQHWVRSRLRPEVHWKHKFGIMGGGNDPKHPVNLPKGNKWRNVSIVAAIIFIA